MSLSANFSAVSEYLKLTWSNTISPFSTSVRAFSGLFRLLSSVSTSQIRRALAALIVIIATTMESIIMLIRHMVE